jgi:hypothetical protein
VSARSITNRVPNTVSAAASQSVTVLNRASRSARTADRTARPPRMAATAVLGIVGISPGMIVRSALMSRHQPISTRTPMTADNRPATIDTSSKAATARNGRCAGTDFMSGRALPHAESGRLGLPTVVTSVRARKARNREPNVCGPRVR